jgi:hypothetical protein
MILKVDITIKRANALTSPHDLRDTGAVAANNSGRDWRPELVGGQPPQSRFFYVRSMAMPYGRAVRGAFGLAGSYDRYANLHGPPTPIGVGARKTQTAS